MSNEKKAKIVEMLENCEILRSYGSKYFACISLIPDIHKAKVDMVEIGKNGKNANSVYLDLEILRQLFEELENGIFVAKIKADKENKYPSAYKFTTGEGGSKQVCIGSGNKAGYVAFQTNVKKGENYDNRIMAVSTGDLHQAGFLFKLCLGLTQVAEGSYYDSLRQIFLRGIKDKARLQSTQPSQNYNSPQNFEKAPDNPEHNQSSARSGKYSLNITGAGSKKKDFMIFPANSKDRSYKVMFRIGEADKFVDMLTLRSYADKPANIIIEADEKDGYLLYKNGRFV